MRKIWDGQEFRDVKDKEAAELVDADKAQDITDWPIIAGNELKYRHQFTGYHEASKKAVSEPKKAKKPDAPVKKSKEPDSMAKAVQTEKMKDWRSYKKAAADALGKAFAKTTKADVEAFLKGDLNDAT